MNRSLSIIAVAGLFSISAFATSGSAKPPGGKEGVMMERSAGEERSSVAAQKGAATAKTTKGKAPAGAASKGMSPMNKDEVTRAGARGK